ncbi:MAG: hypothetical protein QHJ81_16445, partial [Anaerolineae bacterium]|nr:hypothetical protein [Anaerolineae bacterium]
MIIGAFLTNAASVPMFWRVAFGVWLLWMAFDGVRQARRTRLPTHSVHSWQLALIALVVLLVEAAVLFGYGALGRQEFAVGVAAYEAADCRTAWRRFHRVTTLYELTLSSNVAVADARRVECGLFVFAENRAQQGAYAEAVSGYEALLGRYPLSALISVARERAAAVRAEWAAVLQQEREFAAALDQLQIVQDHYADTAVGENVLGLSADVYAAWAAALRAERDYDQAILLYGWLLADYPDAPAAQRAATLAAETYLDWAAALRREGAYETAIGKYQAISQRYPETAAGQESAALA